MACARAFPSSACGRAPTSLLRNAPAVHPVLTMPPHQLAPRAPGWESELALDAERFEDASRGHGGGELAVVHALLERGHQLGHGGIATQGIHQLALHHLPRPADELAAPPLFELATRLGLGTMALHVCPQRVETFA